MNGTMMIIRADGAITTRELDRQPTLEELQAAVGGYLELVPGWGPWSKPHGPFMFCNEEGKLKGLPLNRAATAMMSPAFQARDFLVGDVVVVTGDEEFLAEL